MHPKFAELYCCGAVGEKHPPLSLHFFLPKDLFVCNLFLSGATLVRVLLEKRLPPFLMSRCPEVFFAGVFVVSIYVLFTDEAMCGNFVFGEKTSPPYLSRCCPRRS